MSKTPLFRLAGLALALGLTALPALAQETTTPAPAADAAGGLAMGQPTGPLTQDTAQVGQTYLLTNFETWEQRCVKTEDGSDPCELYQLLKDSSGNPVAEISIFGLPEGGKAAAGASVMVPLETLLTANLRLTIDGAQPKVYPYTACGTLGCLARIGFTAEEVTQFKKGAKATLTLVPFAAPDKTVDLEISLKGFTAGYDAVAATTPKAAN